MAGARRNEPEAVAEHPGERNEDQEDEAELGGGDELRVSRAEESLGQSRDIRIIPQRHRPATSPGSRSPGGRSRALIIPAIMRLLGSANWWMPTWTRAALHLSQREPAAKLASQST